MAAAGFYRIFASTQKGTVVQAQKTLCRNGDFLKCKMKVKFAVVAAEIISFLCLLITLPLKGALSPLMCPGDALARRRHNKNLFLLSLYHTTFMDRSPFPNLPRGNDQRRPRKQLVEYKEPPIK